MANAVLVDNEIMLNGVKYPIIGRVSRELVSRFPQKQIIGDYSYDNEQHLSNWIQSNLSGGIGVEEFDINNPSHSKRCYWSSCDISHPGHITLPPLSTSVTLPTLPTMAAFTSWTKTTESQGGTVTLASGSVTCAAVTTPDSTAVCTSTDASGWASAFQGKQMVFPVTYTATNTTGTPTFLIRVNDGVGNTDLTPTSDGVAHTAYITRTMNASATKISLIISIVGDGTGSESGSLVVTAFAPITIGTPVTFCNFNSNLYLASGANLLKLNSSTGAAYTLVRQFTASITDLCSSVNSSLYVALGDSTYYEYCDTAESFTTSNAYAQLWLEESSTTLVKITNAGVLTYSTDPNSATPTWTAYGSLNQPSGYIRRILKGPDASGSEIIYAATRVGFYAHDSTNKIFVYTNCQLPDNANNGYGACFYQGYLYISSGVRVLKYSPINGTIEEAGLDRDDGVPGWADPGQYITAFIPGQFGMYAMTYAPTYQNDLYKMSPSGAWSIITTGTAKARYCGIISSVFANRFWYNEASTIYYIAEPTSGMRPGKITDYLYANDSNVMGHHITSWFDAGSASDSKVAVGLVLNINGLSVNETVAVAYNIDHSVSPESLSALSWTSLGSTIVASGVTELSFGTSGVGIAFKSIQFKFKLVRGDANVALTPDILSVKLRYMKLVDMVWGYGATLDCSKTYWANTSKQLEAAIKTAADSQILIPLIFKEPTMDSTTPHYVKVIGCTGVTKTGQDFDGQYKVTLLEP